MSVPLARGIPRGVAVQSEGGMTKRPRDRSQRVMQQMRMLRNVVMRIA
jgi:hypothetical protein